MIPRKFTRYGAAFLTLTGVAVGISVLTRPDIYHTKERRQAKSAMISAIATDLESGKTPPKPADDEWMNDRVIFCEDGSWLSYRSRCHKQDPKIYDIFIAKASDEKWYYSTYHFCIGAMVLAEFGQPPSLRAFKAKYALQEFDGKSDAALKPTWPAEAK
jgi:hypothetical protein